MKVIGTGAPRMLTIRVEDSELELLRHALDDRRGELAIPAAAAHAMRRRNAEDRDDSELEDLHGELFLLTRMIDELRTPVAAGERRTLVGPTWLLDPIIRAAATEAIRRLTDAVEVFSADTGTLAPDQLRAALETASASTLTLIGLDHAINHAVE